MERIPRYLPAPLCPPVRPAPWGSFARRYPCGTCGAKYGPAVRDALIQANPKAAKCGACGGPVYQNGVTLEAAMILAGPAMTTRVMRIWSLNPENMLARAKFVGNGGAECWLNRGLLSKLPGVYEGMLVAVTFDGDGEPARVREARTS